MTEERRIQLVAEVDSTRTRAGFDEIARQAGTMSGSVTRASQQADQATRGMGDGAVQAAAKMAAAQRNLEGSIQRTIAALGAGTRGTSEYFENLARQRGIDPSVFATQLAQLRAIEAAQRQAAAATDAGTAAQLRAAEAARTAATVARQAAQVQANGDSFLAGLREQVALYGKSAEEVLRYKAALAGVASAAEPQIQELRRLKAAQDALAESARLAAAAQQQAAQVQTNRDSFLAGLREQIALLGKSTEEVLRYRAAQAGTSGAAEPLIQELQRVKTAQDAVTEAARNAERAQQQAAKVQATGAALMSGLREQVALYGKSTEEVLRYRAAQAGVAGAAEPHIQELKRLKIAEDAVAAAARAAAEAQRQATTAQNGRDTFIAGLERETLAIGKTRTQLLELQAAQMGVSAQAAPFIQRLRQTESGLDHMGMSARATAAALRGVPAQFTDIITSIQGGQNPMTVMLQQGGQLKDMFGGLGAATKAMGGYLLGLINPLTVAAAGAAVLGFAYYQGASEALEFNRVIAISGNAAGVTSGKLADMARNVSKAVGTQGAAAETIAALVATGRVSAGNIEAFSIAAIKGQRALGIAVGDTATEFADLAKAPLSGLEKLNDKYHFLTGSVYEQVKALVDQGKAYEAGQLAQQTFATGFDGVSSRVTENLGTMQKAIVVAKDVWKGFWDAALNVGREDSLDEQLEKVRAKIAKAQKPFDASVGGNSEAKMQLSANQALEISLQKQIALEATKSGLAADQARFNAADLEWSKGKFQYLTRAKQLETELTAEREKGIAAGASDAAINERLAGVRKKYSDIYNASIDSNIEALKTRAAVEDELAKREMAQIAFKRSMGNITEQEGIKQIAELELGLSDRRRASMESELVFIKQKQNSLKDQQAKIGQIAALDEARLTRAKQLTNDLVLLEEKRAQTSRDLFNRGITGAGAERDGLVDAIKAQKEYNEQIGLNKVQVAALQATRIDALATLKDESAAALDALEPGSQLASIYRDQAAALRERATGLKEGAGKEFQFDEWKKAVDTYSDVFRTGFADMLNNGKAGWSSFTKSLVTTFKTSVADQLYKMFAQPFVVQIVANMMGITGGSLATAAQGLSGGSGGGIMSSMSTGASLFSAGKTMYAGFQAGITSSMGGIVSQMGTTFGSTAMSSFGAGMSMTPAVADSMALSFGGQGAVTAGAGASAAGTSAAAYAIPIAGWIALGMTVSNSLYKQGWDSTNGSMSNTGSVLGSGILGFNKILKGIGLSDSAANIFSGQATLSRLFGRKNPEVESTGIEGNFSSAGFTGDNFENILEKGGFFRSDKRYTNTAAVGADQDKFFDDSIKNLMLAVKNFGVGMGIEATQIDGYTKAIKLSLTSDDAKNQEIITTLFGDIGNDLATLLIPTISSFSKASEAAAVTLERLATDYGFIDAALDSINKTFGAVGLDSITARERLLELSGGLDAFGKGAAFFSQNYMTEGERLAQVAKTVSAAFAALGVSAPETRKEFAQLVLGLELTTEKGAATFAGLMKVEEGFALLHPSMEATAAAITAANEALAATNKGYQDQIDEILKSTMSAVDVRALEIAGLDASTVALYDRLAALKGEASANVAAAEAITKARDAAAASAKASSEAFSSFANAVAGTMKSATDAAKALRGYNDALLVGSNSPLDLQGRRDEAAQQFAKSPGDTAASNAFIEAAKALRDAGGTGLAYARDVAQVRASISAAASAKDAHAAAIPDFLRSIRDMGIFGNEPATVSTVPAQIYSANQAVQPGSADMVSRAEFQQVQANLAAALNKIATNTGAAADSLEGITTGRHVVTTEALT